MCQQGRLLGAPYSAERTIPNGTLSGTKIYMQKNLSSIHDYDDILLIERPEPQFHQRMPLSARAAQFAPFAALTGYSEVIREIGRTTEEKKILDEREKEIINRKLVILKSKIKEKPFIRVKFFVPDTRKTGGSYHEISGNLRKIDIYDNCIEFTNGVKISFDDIFEIRDS